MTSRLLLAEGRRVASPQGAGLHKPPAPAHTFLYLVSLEDLFRKKNAREYVMNFIFVRNSLSTGGAGREEHAAFLSFSVPQATGRLQIERKTYHASVVETILLPFVRFNQLPGRAHASLYLVSPEGPFRSYKIQKYFTIYILVRNGQSTGGAREKENAAPPPFPGSTSNRPLPN